MRKEDEDYIIKQCEKESVLIVDTLFDKGLLNPKLKRKDIRALEKLITLKNKYLITSHIKGHELLTSIEKDI